MNSCFELYKKTVNCFHSGGFQLHKWASNRKDLMKLIESDQNSKRPDEPQPKTKFGSLENEQSFAKLSIEGSDKLDLDYDRGKPTKVLGITWDCESDQLIFDLKFLAEFGKSLKPTKRNLRRLTVKLLDPLGLLSPIIFTLKLMFQSTCVNKYTWDDELTGDHLRVWKKWLQTLRNVTVKVPRFYFYDLPELAEFSTLHCFGDTSHCGYAAAIYLVSQFQEY